MPKDMIAGGRGEMLIGRERLFYNGLVGNSMRMRRLGALCVYLGHDEAFEISIDGGPWQWREIVVLPAFTGHRLRAPSNRIINLLIETETVAREELARLSHEATSANAAARLSRRLRAAHADLAQNPDAGGFSTQQFDRYFLRRDLAPRRIDPRIAAVLHTIGEEVGFEGGSAGDYAASLGMSTSRFLHLFKESTDIPFRSYRMWKRARRFMDHANRDSSLTYVALDLGYPDSSHFSHSIRQTFGLQPRSIRQGSRGLRIFSGENYALSA